MNLDLAQSDGPPQHHPAPPQHLVRHRQQEVRERLRLHPQVVQRRQDQRELIALPQNQALSSLLFLYRHVLDRELADLDAVRAKRSRRLPVVLTRGEVLRLLDAMEGVPKLVATLLYGAGLRLQEALRL